MRKLDSYPATAYGKMIANIIRLLRDGGRISTASADELLDEWFLPIELDQ